MQIPNIVLKNAHVQGIGMSIQKCYLFGIYMFLDTESLNKHASCAAQLLFKKNQAGFTPKAFLRSGEGEPV